MFEINGQLLIQAKSFETFQNRKNVLEEMTGFCIDDYEENEGIWKSIVFGDFNHLEHLVESLEKMKKYKWFFFENSWLLKDGKDLFVNGKWII